MKLMHNTLQSYIYRYIPIQFHFTTFKLTSPRHVNEMTEALAEHQLNSVHCSPSCSLHVRRPAVGVPCCFHRLLLGVDLVRFHHLFSSLQFAVSFLVKIYHALRILALFCAPVCD